MEWEAGEDRSRSQQQQQQQSQPGNSAFMNNSAMGDAGNAGTSQSSTSAPILSSSFGNANRGSFVGSLIASRGTTRGVANSTFMRGRGGILGRGASSSSPADGIAKSTSHLTQRGRGRATFQNRTLRNPSSSVPKPIPTEVLTEALGLIPSDSAVPTSSFGQPVKPQASAFDWPTPGATVNNAHPRPGAGIGLSKLYSQAVTGIVPQQNAVRPAATTPRTRVSVNTIRPEPHVRPVRRASAPSPRASLGVMPINYNLTPEQRKEQAVIKIAELKGQREALRKAYIRAGKIHDDTAKVNLSDAVTLIGECEDYCPEYERFERESQSGDVFRFERVPGTDITDHSRMVKRFKRSAAGDAQVLPCDVRTPAALIRSLEFLIHDVIAENGLVGPYYFCWDRTRAIRNDFTLQSYSGPEAVEAHEKIARMHILFAHECHTSDMFSYKQETDEMRKTLRSLHDFYNDRNEIGIVSPNEAEFRAYYILAHLYENDKTAIDHLPLPILEAPIMRLAIKIQAAAQRGLGLFRKQSNSSEGAQHAYTSIFKILSEPTTPVLVATLVWQFFPEIRRGALKAMQEVFYPEHIHVFDLVDLLGYDDEDDAIKDLTLHKIPVVLDESGIARAEMGFRFAQRPGSTKRTRSSGAFSEEATLPAIPRQSLRIIRPMIQSIDLVDLIEGLDLEGNRPIISVPTRPTPSIIKNEPIASPVSPRSPVSAPGTLFNKATGIMSLGIPTTSPVKNSLGLDNRTSFGLPGMSAFTQSQQQIQQPQQQIQSAFASNRQVPTSGFSFLSAPNANKETSGASITAANVKSPTVSGFSFLSEPAASNPPVPVSNPMASLPSNFFQPPSLTQQTQPPPAPVKCNIPSSVINTVFEGMMSDFAKDIANETVSQQRNHFNTQSNAASAIIQHLVDEVIQSEATTVVSQVVNQLKQAARVVDVVASRMIDLVVRDAILEEVVPLYRNLQIQQSAFTFWATRAQQRWDEQERIARDERQRLLEEQKKHVDFMLNAAATIPNGVMGPNPRRKSGNSFLASNDGQGVNHVAQSVMVAKQAEERAMRPLPLLELVYLGRHKRTIPDAYPLSDDDLWLVKFVVSMPAAKVAHPLVQHDKSGWFANTFLRYKLGGGKDKARGLEYLLRDEALIGGEQAIMLVVAVDESPTLLETQLDNFESNLSGSSAAIFVMSLPSAGSSLESYWQEERSRLHAFASHLPRRTSIPLLLIRWVDSTVEDQFSLASATRNLGLNKLQEYGIMQLEVISLNAPSLWRWESFQFDELEQALEDGVKWLSEHAFVAGGVQRHLEQQIKQETDISFESRLHTVEREMKLPLATSMNANLAAVSILTQIHNHRIFCIVGPLYEPTIKLLAWPALEFADGVNAPPIDWNAPHTLARLEESMKPLFIPTLVIPESQRQDGNFETIRDMYIALVEAFVQHLPGNSLHLVTSARIVFERFESEVGRSQGKPLQIGTVFQSMMNAALDCLDGLLDAHPALTFTKFTPLATRLFETHTESLMATWHQSIPLIKPPAASAVVNGHQYGPAKPIVTRKGDRSPAPMFATPSSSRKRRAEEGVVADGTSPSLKRIGSNNSEVNGAATAVAAVPQATALEEADRLLDEFRSRQATFDNRRRSDGYEDLQKKGSTSRRASRGWR
ncbi:hypothetical protein SmJEL517_g05357 [Synchytrium microbalum]|uniref:SAC3/GANP/THP3 conserved domain-containing protein n=1 Tax=Synchytrium microbalum TaxID=1806994 RepID=A0A507C111_9FUNG|nr:uncharacterized protein SmJEL517_g05357 [Synchytrium microbalum]TPX31255.1 hypothetical protein SmJEL517_g05357 [Synchytrium microbalum]